MNRRGSARRGVGGSSIAAAAGCIVSVCRGGGDCGSRAKHPETDHQGQIAQLREALGKGGLRIVDECLDACTHSNVAIVSPSPAGRRAGARPVWLGEVLEPGTTREIVAWALAGGPGLSEPPGLLDLHEFKPTRRSRREAEH